MQIAFSIRLQSSVYHIDAASAQVAMHAPPTCEQHINSAIRYFAFFAMRMKHKHIATCMQVQHLHAICHLNSTADEHDSIEDREVTKQVQAHVHKAVTKQVKALLNVESGCMLCSNVLHWR